MSAEREDLVEAWPRSSEEEDVAQLQAGICPICETLLEKHEEATGRWCARAFAARITARYWLRRQRVSS